MSKEMEEEREKMKLESIQKKYSQVWHENETSIIIKMLDQSIRENDKERIIELQKSLLKLEYDSNVKTHEGSPVFMRKIPQVIPKRTQSSKAVNQLRYPRKSSKTQTSQFSVFEEEYLKKAIMQNTKQYDEQINIMIVGNKGVGKSSLMNAWQNLENPLKTEHTIGYYNNYYRLDSRILLVDNQRRRIRYRLIDSDGEMTNESIRKGISIKLIF